MANDTPANSQSKVLLVLTWRRSRYEISQKEEEMVCCSIQVSWHLLYFQQVNTLSARSFDPGSAQNYGCHMGSDSPDNSKDSSGELADRKQQQEMMMSSTVSRTGETRNPQPSSQEKVITNHKYGPFYLLDHKDLANFTSSLRPRTLVPLNRTRSAFVISFSVSCAPHSLRVLTLPGSWSPP